MVVPGSAAVLVFVVMQAVPSTPPTGQSREIGDAREVTLALPHALQQGETLWLLVEVGAIGHDQIRLTTQDGRPLGSISPYGVRSGQAGGTYTIPVPAEDLSNGRLMLRLAVIHAGLPQQAPTTDEVKSVRLVIRRFADES